MRDLTYYLAQRSLILRNVSAFNTLKMSTFMGRNTTVDTLCAETQPCTVYGQLTELVFEDGVCVIGKQTPGVKLVEPDSLW